MDDPILTPEERESINTGRWFSTLSPTLRHDILRCAYVKRFKDGALIFSRGDEPEEWVSVAKGSARVSSASLTGKQITLTYVEPGTWFGDVGLFDDDTRTHDVYAHGETTLLCVGKAAASTAWSKTSTPCRCVRAWPSSCCTSRAATACPAKKARKPASACNWRKKSWPNCWAPRASA